MFICFDTTHKHDRQKYTPTNTTWRYSILRQKTQHCSLFKFAITFGTEKQ